MEVTKWLKPSDSVSRIGGSASVQAATQVNAEQTSKMKIVRADLAVVPGKADTAGRTSEDDAHRRTGVVAAACTQGKRTQHGKPHWRGQGRPTGRP